MGRRRTTHLHLPAGVYFSRGWYFYREPQPPRKSHPLGKAWDREAKLKYAELSTAKSTDGSVASLLDAYFANLVERVRDGDYSAATLEVNEYDRAELKVGFGGLHYADVTSKHVATFITRRTDKHGRRTPVRANRIMAYLSSAYAWALGRPEYEITANPCYGVRRNRERPRHRLVETAELRRFVDGYAPKWVRCYALLKRLTAMRQGNILALTDENLTERGIRYRQNKRGPLRLIRWSWALKLVIESAKAQRPPLPADVPALPRPLFVNRYGMRFHRDAFKSMWQRAMQAYALAGFERFTEHDLRAKSGSDASSVERAAELLGDTVKTTRKHYRRGEQKVRPLR